MLVLVKERQERHLGVLAPPTSSAGPVQTLLFDIKWGNEGVGEDCDAMLSSLWIVGTMLWRAAMEQGEVL